MTRSLIALVLLLFAATAARATSLDLNLNNDSAQVEVIQPLGADELGTSLLGGRFLYNGDKETKLGSVGFEFVGAPGNIPGLKIGIGVQGYGGKVDHGQELLGAAVGATARFAPPAWGGIALAGKVFFGPKILSGLDSEGLLEAALRIGYHLTPKVQVYLGYQNIRVDLEGAGDRTIDNDLRIGFEAQF